MDWDRLPRPDEVTGIESTPDGFVASVSIPLDDDGFFGRECPSCEGPFKMRQDEYAALPEDVVLTCPYCGHRDEPSAFMTQAQLDRAMAAATGLAMQFVHRALNESLGGGFGRRRRRSGVSVRYEPGKPPPVRALPEVIEDESRRVVECSVCGNHHAVYSATAFCPVCGPRPAAEKVVEAIAAAREALCVEDHLSAGQRETMRDAGVFERFAVDAIESVASLFEVFAREQFQRRVPDAEEHVRRRGNIFQRLDDAAALFAEHANVDLVALGGEERWMRLKRAFARRHVLTHNGGIVDQRFLDAVPDSGLEIGQRLVIRRRDGEAALDDLEALVSALSAAI